MSEHTQVSTRDLTISHAHTQLARRTAAVVGGVLHVVLGVLTAVSGLIMPDIAVRLLGLAWIAGVVLMFQWRRRPLHLVAVPVVLWATWFAVAFIGQTWLGWTA